MPYSGEEFGPILSVTAHGGGGGVTSFNTRTGAVTLSAADVEALFTAVGQLFAGTGSGTGEFLATGTAAQILNVGGADPSGLQWSNTMPTGTILGTSDTQTLTNKRITRRVSTTNAPGATPSMNTDNDDLFVFTGLATAITSMTTNLTGTPNNGDLLQVAFLDNGTARAITWGSSFASSGNVALPGTTVISTRLDVGFVWDTASSSHAWRCIAVA